MPISRFLAFLLGRILIINVLFLHLSYLTDSNGGQDGNQKRIAATTLTRLRHIPAAIIKVRQDNNRRCETFDIDFPFLKYNQKMELKPVRFISESVEARFDHPLMFEKKPGCPQGFVWRGQPFVITELISEWHDNRRRGRMARNMRPEHAAAASQRGSWGVGQVYFRVRTQDGRYFDLYYDRAPKNVDDRKGAWFLDKELAPLP